MEAVAVGLKYRLKTANGERLRGIPSASVNGVSVGNSTAVSAKKKQQWEVAYVCD